MNSSNFSPGVLWTTIATLIPLFVGFINGMSESGVIDASIAAILVIVLSAAARIIEIVRKPAVTDGLHPLGSAMPNGASNANSRSGVARFVFGG